MAKKKTKLEPEVPNSRSKASRKKKAKKTPSVNIKITNLDKLVEKAKCHPVTQKCGPSGGGIYFLGAIGAAIYYISTATGFWIGVLGILKALVWPAFLVFELMKYLGM